jgi:2-succinyl-5-enolpyruvyl-6-hydroxy-3-cyclohexene-1-carboxylate synthase
LNRLWGGIIVEELLRCGAGVFCLSPGSRCAPLTLGVAENARARSVVHFDERGAAYHALGWAKASGRPAVLVCTSGTAAANYLPAVVEASQSRVPLLLLTADRPPELLDAGANQAIDQTSLFGKYARWQYALPCPDESVSLNAVLTTIDQAVFRAVCPPAGPVHLNCQFREPFVSADAWKDVQSYPKQIEAWRESGLPYTAYTKPEYRIGADTVQRILEIVCHARRGLLIIGELRTLAEREAVGCLARALNWPAFPDITSGLRLGNSGSPFVPYYDQMLLSSSVRDACKPDVVIQIGSPFVSKRLLEHLNAFPTGAYVMAADHPLRHDPIHRVTLRVQSEVA